MTRLYRLLAFPPVTRALLLLPIAGFFLYFFTIRFNIPWFDEYENIPYFLDRFLNAPSFGERIGALIRPNNEHRVVYARLVVLAQYYLTGRLNFGQLMLWGNMALVLIFFLLYRALRDQEGNSKKALIGMLPVPLLLFVAQNYLLTFTAIYTLQYLAIIGLVMLTFFVLATNKPLNLGIALALGLLSTFSMGNGMLLWPAGAGMLILQRRWLALAIWLAVGGLGGYLYFLGYPVQQGNAEGFAYVIAHPVQTLFGFLVFAGSVFDFFPTLLAEKRVHLPFIAGLILVGGLAYWIIKSLFQSKKNTSFFDAFILGIVLFLLANIALIAVFRIRFYFGMVLHSSYRTYAMVLWATACVLFYSRLPENKRVRIWPVIWGIFVVVNVVTYITYVPMAVERRKYLQGMAYNQVHSQVGLGGSRDTELARYISNLTSMMHNRGWYSLPVPTITPDEKKMENPVQASPLKIPLHVDQQTDYVVVSSDDPTYKPGLNEGTYMVMKSDRHTYVMFATPNRPIGYFPWRMAPGFSTGIPKLMVVPGHYQLGLFRTYPDHSDLQFANQFVDVE
ncbi:hypothetical protein [Spirosoma pollinicola]|uniref:Glycosyltransferase RgtA/B/C/D-like domain-containing protein n=1 Tax=Spirosoma pollinicola TaxID=2057025 RepID=A0A2K8Z501_9BACT|nr:hypothetical protein [Spirosoma pollinicola]AUD04928.1 hypothetical protein CWM47_25625 [Spirosoma pollinicola]